MKKTNFDHYLAQQLKDETFAERFRQAGGRVGCVLADRRAPQTSRSDSKGTGAESGHDPTTNLSVGIAQLRRSLAQSIAPRRGSAQRPSPRPPRTHPITKPVRRCRSKTEIPESVAES